MWSEDYSTPRGENEHPEEELAAFALNALDDAEFQFVFHHVVQCPHCQEVLLGFRETSARLTGAVAESPLPEGLKARVLAAAVGREATPALVAAPPDPRWSMRRLRRWIAPVAIGTLSVLLVSVIGLAGWQQREMDRMSVTLQEMDKGHVQPVEAAAPVASNREIVAENLLIEPTGPERDGEALIPAAETASLAKGAAAIAAADPGRSVPSGDAGHVGARTPGESDAVMVNAVRVDQMKQDMAEVVEATVLSAQPETEKVPMTSPMGTEPEAKGVLMVEPNGRRGMLMVSGMPADSYQIWLVRGGHQVMVDRVVVNDDDGAGVKQLELDESIFQYQQVALMPDERHGPTNPTGERILSALIVPGPPLPPGR